MTLFGDHTYQRSKVTHGDNGGNRLITSALVRNSNKLSHTWQSALWGGSLDWSDFTNANTCKVDDTEISNNRTSNEKKNFVKVFLTNENIMTVVYFTSSPQFGHAPFSATRSFLHRPWRTLTVKCRHFKWIVEIWAIKSLSSISRSNTWISNKLKRTTWMVEIWATKSL